MNMELLQIKPKRDRRKKYAEGEPRPKIGRPFKIHGTPKATYRSKKSSMEVLTKPVIKTKQELVNGNLLSKKQREFLIQSMKQNGYLDMNQLCKYVQTHAKNIRTWMKERAFPFDEVSKLHPMFFKTDVDSWLKNNRPKIGRPGKPIDPDAPPKIIRGKGRPPKPVDPDAPPKVPAKRGRPFKAPGAPKAPYKSAVRKRWKSKKIFNLQQVREYLGEPDTPLAEKTIRTWIRTRNLPAHKVTPTNLRFVKAEVDKWIITQ
jgi:predicted DNA-binding transcriptional regulator AlpA